MRTWRSSEEDDPGVFTAAARVVTMQPPNLDDGTREGLAATDAPKRVLGVNIAAGVAYLALVEIPGLPLHLDATRIEASTSEPDPTRLRNFSESFRSELRRHRVSAVGVARPLLYRWSYAEAFKRVSLETAMIFAVETETISYESIELHAALKSCGISKPPKGTPIPKQAANFLKSSYPAAAAGPYWEARAVALLAGLALAKSFP